MSNPQAIDWEALESKALELRSQFPVLAKTFDERPLTFLDSTATTQKPLVVIDSMDRFYREHYSSVKRGVYRLSEQTTQLFEACRRKIAHFINAQSENEIVLTRGTTESLNLVAHAWGMEHLRAGDEILLSSVEHHANLVPWQMVAKRTGAVLKFIPCLDNGDLDIAALPQLLSAKTKVLAITHIANSLGTVHPISAVVAQARAVNADICIVLDAAQSAGHMALDVQALDVDFAAFSGHKIYGPTGIGVLYGKYERLLATPPWHGGGEMIDEVRLESSTYALPPARFEAGTPPIAEVLGLSAALDFLTETGWDWIKAHEHAMTGYLVEQLQTVPGLKFIGEPVERAGIASFILSSAHPHDIAMILDEEAIAVRSGHHCAQPVMQRFGVPATVRASIGVYNTRADIDRLVKALHRVVRLFG
jgi:cysteine desulfurase/selenocysteine lyase